MVTVTLKIHWNFTIAVTFVRNRTNILNKTVCIKFIVLIHLVQQIELDTLLSLLAVPISRYYMNSLSTMSRPKPKLK